MEEGITMANEKYAIVTWIGDMRFDAKSGAGQMHITLDGDGLAGQSPMDVLLSALAGCTGMDVVSVLRKMRQSVTGLRIEVHGTRAAGDPKVYTALALEYVLAGHGLEDAKVRRAIELSETRYCSVGAMLEKSAHITWSYRIEEASENTGGMPA
jgi:putative redox protein